MNIKVDDKQKDESFNSSPNSDYKTSRLAIVSLVLGILSFIFKILAAIPAIILGIIALVKISRRGASLKGKGFAIAGIVISIAWTTLYIAVMLPALDKINLRGAYIEQKAQLRTIEIALEIFCDKYGEYPSSSAYDHMKQNYCGAQKLSEALFGQDLKGFHPDSEFRRDGKDKSGKSLYVPATLEERSSLPFETGNISVFQLQNVFKDIGDFDARSFVICDVYLKKRHSGKKTGLPVLYYKAECSNTTMDNSEPMEKRIYNAKDNLSLIRVARTKKGEIHPLENADGEFFYNKTYKIIDSRITVVTRPYKPNSFILISAGRDGLYGTADDITNVNNR